MSATLCMLYDFSLVKIFECYNSSWGSSNVGASLAHSCFSLCVGYISLNIAFQAFAFFLLKGFFVDNFLMSWHVLQQQCPWQHHFIIDTYGLQLLV